MIAQPKPRTFRSPRFLSWLRTLACAWCGRWAPSEASHHGRHGMGQKAPDTSAIPLCSRCHRDHHDGRGLVDSNGERMTGDATREWAERRAAELVARFLETGGRL